MRLRRPHPDLLAIAALVMLWLVFFWRLFTPAASEQASLKQGDFSGQFVAFAGYQYQRFTEGEVPLWNPYNNGGLPFIADTQAAVFYPPRLVTIALARLSGGWSYHALELEMTAHVLAYTLMMYAFTRRLTLAWRGSVIGGLVAALVAGYGGYLTGYPPLQLALLEAGIWLPLAALGILEAMRDERPRWGWLLLTGLGLGLSWIAGHPQTSYFLTLLLVAYFGWNVWTRRCRWHVFVLGTALFGLVAFGLAAVQLIPGIEYLAHTARLELTYEDKGNGFPVSDIVQFVFPGIVSLWSPLWVGFPALALAFIASWRRLPQSRFWGVVALFALLWSFGRNGFLYQLLYSLLPGVQFFRGQERAAYLVANSLAVLAGAGAAWLVTWNQHEDKPASRHLRATLSRVLIVIILLAALVLAVWLISPGAHGDIVNNILFAAFIAGLSALLLSWLTAAPRPRRVFWLLPLLVVVELFAVNMNAESNYDPVPPSQQLSMTPPPLVAQALADTNTPFFVDGFRGLTDNYGSLYGLADIHGISPLFLQGPYTIIEGVMPDPVAWWLFAVRYVYSDWSELPVPAEIVAAGRDRWGGINLFRLQNPRPFASIYYDYRVISSDEDVFSQLGDLSFPLTTTAILERDPALASTTSEPTGAGVTIFEPEHIAIAANASDDGILVVALPYYPGWYATVDDQPADILKAYGAISAVVVPQGEHIVELTYNPLSYRAGAAISLFTWIGLGILVAVLITRIRNGYVRQQPAAGLDRPA